MLRVCLANAAEEAEREREREPSSCVRSRERGGGGVGGPRPVGGRELCDMRQLVAARAYATSSPLTLQCHSPAAAFATPHTQGHSNPHCNALHPL